MKNKLKKANSLYLLLLVGILAGLVLIMSLASPYFFSWKNFRNIMNQSSTYLLLSIGMTFVICSGEIDLSVGSIVGFSGMITGILFIRTESVGIAVVLGLLSGTFVGLVNGVLVSYTKINSFIVTLSTMSIMRALTLIITNSSSIFGFGPVFNFIGAGEIGPINVPILLSILVAVISSVVLHQTKFGNYCLFLGSNSLALNRAGVSVKKYKIIVFMVCGTCASMAAIIVTARLNSAEPLAGQGYEMDAIAMTILGGTSLQGGKGSTIGTIIACLILTVLKNGLTILAISSHYQEVIIGIILLVAVYISEAKARKRSEI